MSSSNDMNNVVRLPAFVTGTSTEYLGRRALPRVVRERPVLFLLGPAGVGKSGVARRLAGNNPLVLTCAQIQVACADRIRFGAWAPELLAVPALVLDGPQWLRGRPAMVQVLAELLQARSRAARRTCVCQTDEDGSLDLLLGEMERGSLAVVGLRFPVGVRGRLRFARRMCDELGLPRTAAAGTEALDPWNYAAVLAFLVGVREAQRASRSAETWVRVPALAAAPRGA